MHNLINVCRVMARKYTIENPISDLYYILWDIGKSCVWHGDQLSINQSGKDKLLNDSVEYIDKYDQRILKQTITVIAVWAITPLVRCIRFSKVHLFNSYSQDRMLYWVATTSLMNATQEFAYGYRYSDDKQENYSYIAVHSLIEGAKWGAGYAATKAITSYFGIDQKGQGIIRNLGYLCVEYMASGFAIDLVEQARQSIELTSRELVERY